MNWNFPTITWSWFWNFLGLALATALVVSVWVAEQSYHSFGLMSFNHPSVLVDWPIFGKVLLGYFLFAAPAYHIGRNSKEPRKEGYRKALVEWPPLKQVQRDCFMSLVDEIRGVDLITSDGKEESEKMQNIKDRIKALKIVGLQYPSNAVEYPSMAVEVLNDIFSEQEEYLRAEYRWKAQREKAAKAGLQPKTRENSDTIPTTSEARPKTIDMEDSAYRPNLGKHPSEQTFEEFQARLPGIDEATYRRMADDARSESGKEEIARRNFLQKMVPEAAWSSIRIVDGASTSDGLIGFGSGDVSKICPDCWIVSYADVARVDGARAIWVSKATWEIVKQAQSE